VTATANDTTPVRDDGSQVVEEAACHQSFVSTRGYDRESKDQDSPFNLVHSQALDMTMYNTIDIMLSRPGGCPMVLKLPT
jgi:hypothetical protein